MEYQNIPTAERALTETRQRSSEVWARIGDLRGRLESLRLQAKTILDDLGDPRELATLRGEEAAGRELIDEAIKQQDLADMDAQSIVQRIRGLTSLADDLRRDIAGAEANLAENHWARELEDLEYRERITQNGYEADKQKLKRLKEEGTQRQMILNYEQRLAAGGFWAVQERDLAFKRSAIAAAREQAERRLADLRERLDRLEDAPQTLQPLRQ